MWQPAELVWSPDTSVVNQSVPARAFHHTCVQAAFDAEAAGGSGSGIGGSVESPQPASGLRQDIAQLVQLLVQCGGAGLRAQCSSSGPRVLQGGLATVCCESRP